ncbi:hypothetical protein KY290_005268 [Solanum tuberosum]|uniref:Retrotransposon gag domain-containing protein n=1 Tax=Solanum tuberosum TaxID=4113 RepID=A0ABQ7WDM0_SOLTU|nr:hypothetical protein KY289_005662 [Solanum tuberosum]KAH0778841.1 hypothetical protein KY290_005268 [Solanum tuberosum]
MTTKFLDKYLSPTKTTRMRKEIINFSQLESKIVFEAWEIFKELLRKCSHNGIEPWLQLTNLWEGLSPASRRILNNAVGESIIKNTAEEASKNVVGKSNEIQKGKEKSELEVDSKYMPALPFPQEMKRDMFEKYFGKFLEMLKQLYVNIPFTEVITQMPAYAKFWKEILSSKRKLEETSVVKLNAHCSAILQNKLPQKCGDPGSFTIPYAIGTARFEKSLCDSRASINLLPLSVLKKL